MWIRHSIVQQYEYGPLHCIECGRMYSADHASSKGHNIDGQCAWEFKLKWGAYQIGRQFREEAKSLFQKKHEG